jgi:dienelactone hydrolase
VSHVRLVAGDRTIEGRLTAPDAPRGVVLVPRLDGAGATSAVVAASLVPAGFAVLALDLLDGREAAAARRQLDVQRLAGRLDAAARRLASHRTLGSLGVAYLGFGDAALVALVAAGRGPDTVDAVVAVGGRPGRVEYDLPRVTAPTLLVAPAADRAAGEATARAAAALGGPYRVATVPGLLSDDDALAASAAQALGWLEQHPPGRAEQAAAA